jgi:DNA polymerase-1
MALIKQTVPIKRYFVRGEFNPRSTAQLLAFMESKGDQGGSAKGSKTGKPSTNKKTLEALAKKDPFYKDILDHRSVGKVRGTYCDGIEKRLDSSSRVHPQFLHKPSTFRLSARNPNLQNVVADKEDKPGEKSIASGFRDCVVAEEGCVLIEADLNAVEALLVGWLIRDPNFMRLATLGIHSWHASHILGQPVSLDGSDAEVGKKLKVIKELDKVQYNKSKITIYGSLYDQSAWGLQKTYPEIFKTVADAARNQELLYRICPKLKDWHNQTRLTAHKQGYISNPFGHRHWFWDVFAWNPKAGNWGLGSDAKSVLAFGPQSIGYGIIAEAAVRAAERIKDCYRDSKTPIRALIHDSILGEVREDKASYVAKVLSEEMSRPVPELKCDPAWGFGECLSVGVSVKIGKSWSSMENWNEELGVAAETAVRELEEEEEDVA